MSSFESAAVDCDSGGTEPSASISTATGTQPSGAAGASPPPKKKLKGLAAVLTHIEEQQSTSENNLLPPREKLNMELSSYLDIPSLGMDADPLEWWKIEHLRFPHLAQLARKYLCVCGTSVPSERMFSLAGHITNGRSRLLPENVNKLVFLARNM